MFYIAICDDDEVLCNHIESDLLGSSKTNDIKVNIFYTAEKLYEAMHNGRHYDLIFLDIEFREMNGVELGRKIRNELNNNTSQIVYISGNQEYAMDLFSVRPMNFLVKPFSKQELLDNLETAMRLVQSQNNCFECKCDSEWLRIPYNQIMYLESDNRKIKIHTQYDSKTMYGVLNKVSDGMPSEFIRVHQSYLVNRIYIRKWKHNEITLVNDEIVPVSSTYRKKLAEVIFSNER